MSSTSIVYRVLGVHFPSIWGRVAATASESWRGTAVQGVSLHGKGIEGGLNHSGGTERQ